MQLTWASKINKLSNTLETVDNKQIAPPGRIMTSQRCAAYKIDTEIKKFYDLIICYVKE